MRPKHRTKLKPAAAKTLLMAGIGGNWKKDSVCDVPFTVSLQGFGCQEWDSTGVPGLRARGILRHIPELTPQAI